MEFFEAAGAEVTLGKSPITTQTPRDLTAFFPPVIGSDPWLPGQAQPVSAALAVSQPFGGAMALQTGEH